jgi:dTDP-4-amino-4,6-dideoxygalactose transaminase
MAIHEEQAHAGETLWNLPHTEAAARDVIMLPLFAELTFEEQDYVIERLAEHVVELAA